MSRDITPDELRRFFPKATKSAVKVNSGVGGGNAAQAPVVKRRHRNALQQDDAHQEDPAGFYFVLVKSYQFQLQDFDNPLAKLHVDALRYSGIIPDDNASICDGRVERIEVATRAEERTVLEIYFESF